MSHQSALIEEDILAYLGSHQNKSLLRFITCGSVDDGKPSTLIGLFLRERCFRSSKTTACSTRKRSEEDGHPGRRDRFLPSSSTALPPSASRGITIDVAYRFFSTDRRKFIVVADTPGHEQYTRNIHWCFHRRCRHPDDRRRKGGAHPDPPPCLHHQAGRHPRHLVLAINKMDLVGYSKKTFDAIDADFRASLKTQGHREHHQVSRSRR
ncbi:MAG: GTP-binding protein [Geminicoccaceae bacterium]